MYYKTLSSTGTSCHGGDAKWFLPTPAGPNSWEPGEWMPPIVGQSVMCRRGYHLTWDVHLLTWLGPTIYEAEPGSYIEGDNKIACRSARLLRPLTWTPHIAHRFSCDCVSHAMELRPNDPGIAPLAAALNIAISYSSGTKTEADLEIAYANMPHLMDAADSEGDRCIRWALSECFWPRPTEDRNYSRVCEATTWAARSVAEEVVGDSYITDSDSKDYEAFVSAWEVAYAAERQWQYTHLLTYLYPANS